MIVLSDKNIRENLFPFTLTRHAADIRVGILTIKEKWELLLGQPVCLDDTAVGTTIPASVIPTLGNYKAIIQAAEKGEALQETEFIKIISFPWHIFQLNAYAIGEDFALLTQQTATAKLDSSNKIIGGRQTFIGQNVSISHAMLNDTTGPIYIAAGAQIMEGCMIRGPFSLGENSMLKMGTKIYGATTVGPNCVVGGEVKNSVIFGHSNKAHDGYLGDSVIGEWCNLGAGSSNSNVKNTAGNIGYTIEKDTQAIYAGNKAGLLMGDYSRAAINTAFNTGTTVGVCCNIFGHIMPDKYIDNFSWGSDKYIFEKAIMDIDNWKKMKNKTITDVEINTLRKLYEQSLK